MPKGILQKLKLAFIAVLGVCAVIVVYKTAAFFWDADNLRAFIWKVADLFVWMLKEVFIFSLPTLILPIVIYLMIQAAAKNPIARFISGIGAIYLFWLLSDDLTLSLSSVWNMIRLSIQIYFLLILVAPQELMMAVGAVACMAGSLIIDFIPDLPGSLDDMAAICTLITMVFVYLNTLAILIKRNIGPMVSAWSHGDVPLASIIPRKKNEHISTMESHVHDQISQQEHIVKNNKNVKQDGKQLKDEMFGN